MWIKGKRGLVIAVGAFSCLTWLTLPQAFQQVVASSQEGRAKSRHVADYFDIRVSNTEEAKEARTRVSESLVQWELSMGLEMHTASTGGRRAEALVLGDRSDSETIVAMRQAERQLAKKMRRLSVAHSVLMGTPAILEGRQTGRSFLTQGSRQRTDETLRRFLTENATLYGLTERQVSRLKVTTRYTNPAKNLSWVVMSQDIGGIPVFQGDLVAAFTREGELVRTVSNLASGLETEGKPPIDDFRTQSKSIEDSTRITAAEAVARAAKTIGVSIDSSDLIVKTSSKDGTSVVFDRGPFANDVKVELVYFPLKVGAASLAWSMVLWQDNPAYYTLVDANEGELLWRKNITDHQTQPATYSVYNDDSPAPLSPTTALPGSGVQGSAISRTLFTLISELPGFDNLGWITDGANTTTGNNVDAGLDLVAPNGIDAGGRPVGSPARVFDFSYNPPPGGTDAPTIANYRNGAVTNLFFWSNRYHDRLYELGFTEAALNFQQDNFGRGGLGNDRVMAEAQDFSGTSNANFSTPPDGSSGRMQMFIFDDPSPDRDGDLDQEIILHELTHGTSNRLHANAAGLGATISGGMGEGWSDFYARALLSTADEDINGLYPMGGYATFQLGPLGTDNYYYGIRRFPYAVKTALGSNGQPHNPLTFADADPAQIDTTDGAFPQNPIANSVANQVHNLGEIWCMALLEVRARIITRVGFAAGNQRALQIVTDGMKLDPANPNFLQGRDAILAADCAGFAGTDELDIWSGFAARGMGFSARFNSGTSVTEAFDTPHLTLGSVTVLSDDCEGGDGFADPGETVSLNVPLTNPFCATSATGVDASIVGGGSASYGTIAAGATVARSISFTVPPDTPCGTLLAITVNITSGLGPVSRTLNLQIGRPVVVLTATYSSGNIAVPIPDAGSVEVPMTVADVGAVADVNVRVRLNHTFDGDLILELISPDGTSVPVAQNRGGAGDNFGIGANDCSGTPTVFDDSAATSISAGTAPFAGSFRPDSPLSALNGRATNGTWKLRVSDTAALDVGTVGCVQLEISRQRFACCGVAGVAEIQAAPPAVLTAESCTPPNGAPDPNESVTMSFPLLNIGTDDTTNLVATLLPSGGVFSPSGPQTYGALTPGGSAVSRPFSFVATGTCGGTVTATLQLQDGATDLGTVTFTLQLGALLTTTTSFSNTGAIDIPNPPGTGAASGAPSAPYPSTITVSGLTGTVSKVTVSLTNLSHTFPGDMDMLLVGPGGQKILLMSDVGGGTDAVNVNLTFDDAAAGVGATLVSGTFSPSNVGTGDLFPATAPAGPYPDPQALSVFNGVNPNGTWSLFVVDDAASDTGSMAGGWSLAITTGVQECCVAACTLTCPPNVTRSNDANQCGAVVTYSAPATTGNCVSVTCSPASASFFPVGTTTVTCGAADGASCSFTVTVNDTQPPSISCPTNVAAVATVACPLPVSTTATFPNPGASDNCPGVTAACVPPSGTVVPVGTTTVACTATDASGNTASCSFTVSVFSVCIQDDSNPGTTLFINRSTGAYRFTCNGTVYSGTGVIKLAGCTFTLDHNGGGRRVLATVNTATRQANATLQQPSGVTKCTITDRNMADNNCLAAP